MVDWDYLLFAQYPAFLLLSVLFLLCYLRVRKTSALKSMLWVLLFGAALAVSVLFSFLGVHKGYWTLAQLTRLSVASWIGVALVFITMVVRVVHLIEKTHSRRVMAKELEKAARDKEDAVARARAEGAEAGAAQVREETYLAQQQQLALSKAKAAAEALGDDPAAPISLTLEESAAENE